MSVADRVPLMTEYIDMSSSSGSHQPSSGVVSDPFYVVKDKVQILARQLKIDFDQWKDLLETTNTDNNDDFRQVTHAIKGAVRKVKLDLKDLTQTIDIVSKNRARFKDIDDEELDSRSGFVNDMKALVEDVQETFSSDRTRNKLKRDKQRKKHDDGGLSALEREAQRGNDDFIGHRQQGQQLLEHRQDEVLDDMSAVLRRLGNVADTIGVELDDQAMLLEEVEEEMDEAQDRLSLAMKKIEKILGTSDRGKLCCLLLSFALMIGLFVAVIYT